MKLVILMTAVVLVVATEEDQTELAQRIVDTEAEFANLIVLKNWDHPEANIYSSLASICGEYLENLKQKYITQFNVNVDQYPETTFPVVTIDGEKQVAKPTKRQSVVLEKKNVMASELELSQKIVNQQVMCDQMTMKNEGDIETCRKKLNCMKKSYMEENQYTNSNHINAFPIEYKGEYASMSSPPENTECEENTKPRRKRSPSRRQGRGTSKARRRRASNNHKYRETSNARRRRSPEYERAASRRRRASEHKLHRNSRFRRARGSEFPREGPKLKVVITEPRDASDKPKTKSEEEVFPSFADKWVSKMNNPKLTNMYGEAKRSYEKKPKGDSGTELRRNLAVGLKGLIHTALLYKHSYDPANDEMGTMAAVEVELVDWLARKLVDMTIKNTLANK